MPELNPNTVDPYVARPTDVKESVAPDGRSYPIPSEAERAARFEELAGQARAHRAEGRKVVVVQGLGFVGTAVAGVVAAAADERGAPRYFVIGVDLPTAGGYWKVGQLNDGTTSIVPPESELARLLHDGVRRRNLCATTAEQAYGLADVIVVDVHLDVRDVANRDPAGIEVDTDGFKAALRAVGRHMPPDALVLIETTVPVGTCERIALPVLREERARRGVTAPLLLAHAYERVTPGPDYVASVRRYWRTFAGVDPPSAARAREFLSSFIDTAAYPLKELDDPAASELAKVLENSYRAANIALIHEWTLLAEQIGVDLFAVVRSIRVRKGTHDNMRLPGFGVGGYCLTKDSLLAQWSATHVYGTDCVLGMTLNALEVNYHMPLHTLRLVGELVGGGLAGKRVAVCGVSYLPDVGDTRNSPTELFVGKLLEAGARVAVHDTLVKRWPERPDVPVSQDLAATLRGADAVVFAVPHAEYRDLAARDLLRLAPPPAGVVDAQDVIPDEKAAELRAGGCRLLGVGKGHWRKRGYQCAS